METKDKFIITPKTKVLQLIETYPELEVILIEYAPAFQKLKNPVLRKTVAKIATLQQAAAIGGVKVEDLINRLRKEAGQEFLTVAEEPGYNYKQPAWFSSDLVAKELDASEMLAVGEQPVNQIIADVNSLETGKIFKLTAPFLPAPAIDKATSLGCKHWIKKQGEGSFTIYLLKT
jgi:hypothetical protein